MIWNIPIESLEERYSAQWNKWFPKYFEMNNIAYEDIYPLPLSNEINDGAFLDIITTNHFKASQLQAICKLFHMGKVNDGDVFFFHDLWFPGLEMLAYIRDGLGIKFRITGVLHAGTWDHWDYLSQRGMGKWAKDLENSWLKFIDSIFVATSYHKQLIVDQRITDAGKIHVTGLPIYDDFSVEGLEKENIVVFPHRLDKEKQPHLFDRLEKELKEEKLFKDWTFVKTKEVCNTKEEYYNLLSRAKIAVSFALQETWGIAMQEALFCGCIPFVPNRLSYSEMYSFGLRSSVFDSTRWHLQQYAQGDAKCPYAVYAESTRRDLLKRGKVAIPNIVRHLLGE